MQRAAAVLWTGVGAADPTDRKQVLAGLLVRSFADEDLREVPGLAVLLDALRADEAWWRADTEAFHLLVLVSWWSGKRDWKAVEGLIKREGMVDSHQLMPPGFGAGSSGSIEGHAHALHATLIYFRYSNLAGS